MSSPKYSVGVRTSKRQYRIASGTTEGLPRILDSILSDIGLRLDSLDAIAQSSDHRGGKIINLGDGVLPKDAVNVSQLQMETRLYNVFYFFMGSGGVSG